MTTLMALQMYGTRLRVGAFQRRSVPDIGTRSQIVPPVRRQAAT